MPNWVTHMLKISATPDLLSEFLERHFKSLDEQLAEAGEATDSMKVYSLYPGGVIKETASRSPTGPLLDFETILPLDDRDASEVWGTKWPASMGTLEGEPSTGEVTVRFDTAWDIPIPIFEMIAALYPALKLDGFAFDELWNFAAHLHVENGRFQGEELEPSIPIYRTVYGKDPQDIPEGFQVTTPATGGTLLMEERFLSVVRFGKAIARAQGSSKLTPLHVLAGAVFADRNSAATSGHASPYASADRFVKISDACARSGIDLDRALDPVEDKMPLSDDLRRIVGANSRKSLKSFIDDLVRQVFSEAP